MAAKSDTIYALSTPPGRGGVAVIRISGPGAGGALEAVAGRPRPAPRHARLCNICDPASGLTIDRGLILWFPGPASFTGEDLAELHLHAGRAVVAAAVEALGRCPGLRLAEPGEFARRAFDHGKLDLAEVEGLADLINAETEAQRRQALRQAAGDLSRLIEGWRSRLLALVARVEAAIDFPDEDLPADLEVVAAGGLAELGKEIEAQLAQGRSAERLRDGFMVAIVGAPNVGKSSLLNALARRDVAIVSDTAGTTRDIVEVHLDLRGYPVILADTAGLREAGRDTTDPVEREGIARARARAAAADLKLVVVDARTGLADEQAAALVDGASLVAFNKADLAEADLGRVPAGVSALAVSARTGAGLAALTDRLAEAAEASLGLAGEAASVTRARHHQALAECAAALVRAGRAGEVALLAEDLRLAVRALGRITGRVDVEDILDVIFGEFCIGK